MGVRVLSRGRRTQSQVRLVSQTSENSHLCCSLFLRTLQGPAETSLRARAATLKRTASNSEADFAVMSHTKLPCTMAGIQGKCRLSNFNHRNGVCLWCLQLEVFIWYILLGSRPESIGSTHLRKEVRHGKASTAAKGNRGGGLNL